jgi:arylsulfatase A-like enzyme
LFRITQDYHEERNAAQDYPQVVEDLTKKLNAWWDPAKPQAAGNPVSSKKPGFRGDADRPNILFFLSDDQRADFLGCAGHGILQTPFIDDLAHRGVRFENAFVTTSICAASRATLLTGMWERTHKYTFGTPPIAGEFVDTSYPKVLKDVGYRTGFIGKYGVGTEGRREAEMFDVFEPVNRNPYFHKQPDGSLRHESDICGDKAIEFVRGAKDGQPWCLSVSFNASHAEDNDKENHFPFPPSEAGFYADATIPPPLVDTDFWQTLPEFFHNSMHRERYFWRWDTPEKYQRNVKAYYRMITGLDRNIGRVLKELARNGMADDTVVIFMGDNGYYKASRGFAGKWSHYEESLRVPLVVFDPRLPLEHRGRVDSHLALNVDVPATICGLGTGSVPESYQGRDLMRLVEGQAPDDWRTDFFCEHLMDNPAIPKWEGVRDERYVYARYFEHLPEGEFLHDLQLDPKQLQNLAGDAQHRELLERMRRRSDELRDSLGGEYTPEKFPTVRRRPRQQPQPAGTN